MAPRYDDPRWKVVEEHEDPNGTWTQSWEIVDENNVTLTRTASGINPRARTHHPPEDVA